MTWTPTVSEKITSNLLMDQWWIQVQQWDTDNLIRLEQNFIINGSWNLEKNYVDYGRSQWKGLRMWLWHYETVTLWHCNTVTLWNCANVKLWHCETVTPSTSDRPQPISTSNHEKDWCFPEQNSQRDQITRKRTKNDLCNSETPSEHHIESQKIGDSTDDISHNLKQASYWQGQTRWPFS